MTTFPPDRLVTERLLLRRPRLDDAQTIFERWGQDPDVSRYLLWSPHKSVDDALDFLGRTVEAWETGRGHRPWIIETEGRAIGCIGTSVDRHRVEVGYLLAQPEWGRGYMAEAVAAVVEAAFQDPAVERVYAACDAVNHGSVRVMQKAGLRYEGLLRAYSPHPNVGPEARDCFYYGLSRPSPRAQSPARPLTDGRGVVCERVLRALPSWFGLEQPILDYIRAVEGMACWSTYVDDEPVSFLAVERHNARSAEVHVMGVLPDHHGAGHGTELLRAAEASLARAGVRYLQVKTLAPSRPDTAYAATRAFYQARGFEPLTEFPTLWDAANPCLQMIKVI